MWDVAIIFAKNPGPALSWKYSIIIYDSDLMWKTTWRVTDESFFHLASMTFSAWLRKHENKKMVFQIIYWLQ